MAAPKESVTNKAESSVRKSHSSDDDSDSFGTTSSRKLRTSSSAGAKANAVVKKDTRNPSPPPGDELYAVEKILDRSYSQGTSVFNLTEAL